MLIISALFRLILIEWPQNIIWPSLLREPIESKNVEGKNVTKNSIKVTKSDDNVDHESDHPLPADNIAGNAMIAKPAFGRNQYQIKIGPAQNNIPTDRLKRSAENSVREIVQEIKNFENELSQDEEAYMAIIGGPSGSAIFLSGIIALGLDKVIFVGQNQKGEKARLIQHVSQINIMLQSMSIKPEIKPRRFGIGFHTSIKNDEDETQDLTAKEKSENTNVRSKPKKKRKK